MDNKLKAFGIAAGLLFMGLYKPSIRSVEEYKPVEVTKQEYNKPNNQPYINETLRQNMVRARRLFPEGIFEESKNDEESIEKKLESCINEFDFEVICGLEEITVFTNYGNRKDIIEIPIKVRSKRGEAIYRTDELDESYKTEIVCSNQKRVSAFLYDIERAYGTNIFHSNPDPEFAKVLALDEDMINQALECINGHSNAAAYALESGKSHTVDLEGKDLRDRIDLARKALEEFKEKPSEVLFQNNGVKSEEVILFELSRISDSDEAINVLREFDERGEYLLRALTVRAFENKDTLPETLDFIEDSTDKGMIFDATAGRFLDILLKSDNNKGYSITDIERSRNLLGSIETRLKSKSRARN
ncbi:MAG: hypothetical protein Q8Q01_04575 [archaeon]|nr:hypothetical protein [archaeon]